MAAAASALAAAAAAAAAAATLAEELAAQSAVVLALRGRLEALGRVAEDAQRWVWVSNPDAWVSANVTLASPQDL